MSSTRGAFAVVIVDDVAAAVVVADAGASRRATSTSTRTTSIATLDVFVDCVVDDNAVVGFIGAVDCGAAINSRNVAAGTRRMPPH